MNYSASILTLSLLLIFFIFSAEARAAQDELPRRGFLGAQISRVQEETAAQLKLPTGKGVQILRIDAKSAAEEAGLTVGDVIVKLNNSETNNPDEFVAAVKPFFGADKFQLTILRNGQEQVKTVTLKPRPFETNPDFDILYRSVRTENGRRRVIVTKPKGAEKHPAVLLVGGIGCYSLDNISPEDSYARILYGLTRAGFATMRVEKSGMGDSEGAPCQSPQVDVRQETKGYVAGLRALKTYDFVDTEQVFIFGHSIGGIVGPLVAGEVPVKGLIVAETIGTNWLEYDFENYRRQAVLRNTPYDEIERQIRQNRVCKEKMWFENQTPDQIISEIPACAGWLQAPASYTYMRQLVELNLGDAWKKVNAPTLVIYGTSDFVTSAAEHVYLRDMINSFHQNRATYVEIPQMDHYLARAATQRESLEREMNRQPGQTVQFHEQIFDETLNWLKANLKSNP